MTAKDKLDWRYVYWEDILLGCRYAPFDNDWGEKCTSLNFELSAIAVSAGPLGHAIEFYNAYDAEYTTDPSRAHWEITGFIKWDHCFEFATEGSIHCCGFGDAQRYIEAFDRLRMLAATNIPRWLKA